MCIKESWEIELGAHSHVMEGVVDEMGVAMGALQKVHVPQVIIIEGRH